MPIFVLNLFRFKFYSRLIQRILSWIFNTLFRLFNFRKFHNSWFHTTFMFFKNLQFYNWTPTLKKFINVIISCFIWNLIKIYISILIDKVIFMRRWFFIPFLFETFFKTEFFFFFNKFSIISSFLHQHFIIFFFIERITYTVSNLFLR